MSNVSTSRRLTETESSVVDFSQSMTGMGYHTSISSKESDESSTDINVTDSLCTSNTTTDISSQRMITKDLINKKQIQRDLELARIELTQRNLMIDSMKAEYLSKLEELEERISDKMHQNQVLSVHFENQLRNSRQDFDKERKRLQSEVESLSKQLKEKAGDTIKLMSMECKEVLNNLEIDDDEYQDIKIKAVEDRTLWEVIAVKFYDSVKPLKVQCESLQNHVSLCAMEMNEKELSLANAMKELEEERQIRTEIDLRCQRLEIHSEDLRDQLKRKEYKSENFSVLQSERNQVEKELLEVRKSYAMAHETLESKISENSSLQNELNDLRQSVLLLRQDKVYLTKELADLKPRHDLLEEKVRETSKMLEDARNAKEECYDKCISSRDRCKLEYETKLQREIGELSKKTELEIKKIKASSSEIYEQENRALREARDDALNEKQRFELAANDADKRYKELMAELKQLQLSSESKVMEAYNECKLKSFELERMQLVLEERRNDLKKSVLENDKATRQKEELKKEYNNLLISTNKRITELEAREFHMSRKLDIYEKVEEDLDNVIMQAAEVSGDAEAETIMFSCGYGSNIPSSAKRRMQQSIHLAKRVLQLERLNASIKLENEKEKQKSSLLSKELCTTKNLLSEAKQPYNCLIDSIKVRDDENRRMKDNIDSLTDDIRRLTAENKSLKVSNDQITLDMERLLTQKEEVSVLKNMILGMRYSNESDQHRGVDSFIKRDSLRINRTQKNDANDSHKATIIPETPSWYSKLKVQNTRHPPLYR